MDLAEEQRRRIQECTSLFPVRSVNNGYKCKVCDTEVVEITEGGKKRFRHNIVVSYKRCTHCNQVKPANNKHFYNRKASTDGFASYCVPCDPKRAKNKRDSRRVAEVRKVVWIPRDLERAINLLLDKERKETTGKFILLAVRREVERRVRIVMEEKILASAKEYANNKSSRK